MIAAIHLRATEDPAEFQGRAAEALRVLAARPGYLRGSLGRAADDEAQWLLLTEWESVGAYRRALGNYQVKLVATPVLASAEDRPSAFESLLVIGQDGVEDSRSSDRAVDADWAGRFGEDGSTG